MRERDRDSGIDREKGDEEIERAKWRGRERKEESGREK